MRIWTQFRKHFSHVQALVSMPLASNFLFKPSLINTAFVAWARKINRVEDLFVEGTFAPFDYFVSEIGLPRSHFFRYLQVRDFVRAHFRSFPLKPDISPLDDCFALKPHLSGGVSQLCTLIQSMKCLSLLPLKVQWEEDLNVGLTDDIWQRAIHRIYTSSICVRHKLIQFKVFNRLHLSRTKLAKIYPNVDPNCICCHQAPASVAHMFWSCPSLGSFWSERD